MFTDSDTHSLDFLFTRILMKVFNCGSMSVIHTCMDMFGIFKLSEVIQRRKVRFLNKFISSDNLICQLLSQQACQELIGITESAS